MKKTILLSVATAFTAVCFALPQVNPQKAWRPTKASGAEKSVSAMPKLVNKTTIQCGNKKVTLMPDGVIRISNSAGEIATIHIQYIFVNKENGKTDWANTTPSLCKMRQEGNSVIWEIWKKNELETWKIADQTLEILEDGNLKLSAKTFAPKDERLMSRGGRRASYFIMFPVAGNEGKKLIVNDVEHTLGENMKPFSLWRGKRFDYVIFADDPLKTVGLKSVNVAMTNQLITQKRHRIDYNFQKDNTCSFLIDLRKSAVEKTDTANTGAGVNFKQIENVELLWKGKNNLLTNSGFEQGFHCWKSHSGFYSGWWENKWNFVPFEISKDAFHGSSSLLMRGRDVKLHDCRNLRGGINLTGNVMLLQPGKYTLSFYAKTLSGKAKLSAWIHNYHTVNQSHYACPHSTCFTTVTPSADWKRYTQTMTVEKATPTALSINVSGASEVLIDAIQFEKGTQATAYEFPPAVGTLLTSADDNFISSKKKIDAKVKIFSKPDTTGKVAVRVKNFFGEIVCNTTLDFKTDSKGYSTVALPFDKLGKGLFMVRFDYQLADGSKSFDLTRFAVTDHLKNTHRWKNIFSDDYGLIENHYNFTKILERWRKIGIGAKTHVVNREPMFYNKYREYGVELTNASIATMLWKPGTTKVAGFGITDKIPLGLKYTDSDKFIIKDHNSGNNGVADDAFFKRVEKAAEQVARTNNHITCWTFYAEIRAKFSNDWWSKEATDEKATELHIRYIKAIVDGVRRGNPAAKIFQDAPCNMRPDGGIAETAKLLSECNKHGIKFDLIAIHPYRFSPESPDLDADTQTLFKALKKCGYGDDTPVMWPELMHWGPYNIPQWGTESSTWGNTPKTWPGWTLTYDIGETEKLSAAWRARSWLVALKYADRITTATSGSGLNNFSFDENLTPYATQMIFNTLGNVLGDSTFKKDIRFAPFIRSYVFEDAQKHPVAAVWCHMEKVDNGYIDAPVAEADFGNSLESVIDLMNSKRAFTNGKFKFPVSSFPIFLRGKPGTLDKMIKALEKATIISGEGISPVEASANPLDNKTIRVTLKNFLTSDFNGTFNGKPISIPGSGTTFVDIPAPVKITKNKIVKEQIKAVLKSDKGQSYEYDLGFTALAAGKVDDSKTFDNIDWNSLPETKFTANVKKKETSGSYRLAWNKFGFFIQVQVADKKFTHIEYSKTPMRWKNDCLQIYIDTMANARSRQFKGYDEDDYDYALFPNSKGDSSIVWRNRSVEQQLGLATQAPKDQTVAHDIPSSFSNKNGILTYRVFFPAKYLLPARMHANWVMALGLYAANSDKPGTVSSALTNTSNGNECYNSPHIYPALLLED